MDLQSMEIKGNFRIKFVKTPLLNLLPLGYVTRRNSCCGLKEKTVAVSPLVATFGEGEGIIHHWIFVRRNADMKKIRKILLKFIEIERYQEKLKARFPGSL